MKEHFIDADAGLERLDHVFVPAGSGALARAVAEGASMFGEQVVDTLYIATIWHMAGQPATTIPALSV